MPKKTVFISTGKAMPATEPHEQGQKALPKAVISNPLFFLKTGGEKTNNGARRWLIRQPADEATPLVKPPAGSIQGAKNAIKALFYLIPALRIRVTITDS